MINYIYACIKIEQLNKIVQLIRGIAQLVEHRSPKPSVVSSNLTAPAIKRRPFWGVFLWHLGTVDENSRRSEFEPQFVGGRKNADWLGQTNKVDADFFSKNQVNLTAPATKQPPFNG